MKFEYLVENPSWYADMQHYSRTEYLKIKGEEGWELCGVENSAIMPTFYFKKPIPTDMSSFTLLGGY